MTSITGPGHASGTRAWRCADLGGLELFRAAVSQFAFRPHAHEEFFIALTETGLAMPVYRGDKHVVGQGDMIVLNPEEAHAGGPPAGRSWTYRAIYAPAELMHQVTAEFSAGTRLLPRFAVEVVRDPRVATLLHRFHKLSESPGLNALHREAYLAEGLMLLAGRHATHPGEARPPGHEPRAVRVARDYMHEHIAENFTLMDLARHTELTPYHLCRVFRQATGMPPHAYQTQIRVRRAKALLLARRPIAQVAAETGFWDQAHLTRHFKRILGLSPGRYTADLTAQRSQS